VAEEWKKAIEECGQNAAPEAVKLAAARGTVNGKVSGEILNSNHGGTV
jgi:hypothetical protein